MKWIILLLIATILCCITISSISSAHLNSPLIRNAIDHYRGGSKSSKRGSSHSDSKYSSSKASKSKRGDKKQKKKKDDEPKKTTTGSQSNSRKMEMVPYNSKNNQKQKGASFRERLERIAKSSLKQGQILSKEAFRRAKVVRSSAFEGMLLKATWPSNDPVQPEILNEIVKYSIPAFKFSSSNSDDDPYYMTMHKLWTKMCENDWRTIAKSLHILHTIARDCQPDACERFSFALRDMAKTRNPKKPDQRYFDANCLSDLDDNSSEYEEYIQAYAKYVIYRMKSFTGKYDELSQLNKKTPEKKVIATLIKAQQCVTLALETADSLQKSQVTVITGYNMKLLVQDLIDLWTILEEKMILLFLSSDVTTTTTTTVSNSKDIVKILRFYKGVYKKIDQFILNASKSYMKLRIKIPSKVERSSSSSSSTSVAEEVIAKRIAQLTSLHGGYVRRDAEEVARSLSDRESLSTSSNDDDDEEEDGDEEEEDGDEEDDDDDEEEGNVDEDDADDGEEEDEINSDKDDDSEDDDEDIVGKGVNPSKPPSRKPESVDTDDDEEDDDLDEDDDDEEGKTDSTEDVDDEDDDEEEKDGDTEDDENDEEEGEEEKDGGEKSGEEDDDDEDDDADDEDDKDEDGAEEEEEEDDSNDDDDDEEDED